MQKIVMASGAMNLFEPVVSVLHHAVYKFHQHLDRRLQFARHTAGRAPRGDGEYENEDEGQSQGEKYAVQMDGPKSTVPRIHV